MYDGSVGKSLGGCHKQRRQNRFRGDEKRPPFTFVVGHMSDLNLLSYKVGSVYVIQKGQKVTRQQEMDDVFRGLVPFLGSTILNLTRWYLLYVRFPI